MVLNNKKAKTGKKKFIPKQVLIDPKKSCIRIYTDGSCLVNPGGAGTYSFVIVEDDKAIHEYGEHYLSTTNNRMEIMAVLNAIEFLSDCTNIEQAVIYTDSTYVYNGIINKAGKKANKNSDLWATVQRLVADNPYIQYMWTQGHAGQKWNEYADEMCRKMYKKNPIADTGYNHTIYGTNPRSQKPKESIEALGLLKEVYQSNSFNTIGYSTAVKIIECLKSNNMI